jgi:hypothetical protein
MKLPPSWLPPLIDVNGDWDSIEKRLYDVYERDFKQQVVLVNGVEIRCDQRILPKEKYEEGFWHLVTRTDQRTGERLFDSRRAERLAWCSAILRHATDPEIKMWEYIEGNGKIRTYLWLEQCDYVVIVERRSTRTGAIAFLITAYHIDGDSRRRNLKQKYDRRKR